MGLGINRLLQRFLSSVSRALSCTCCFCGLPANVSFGLQGSSRLASQLRATLDKISDAGTDLVPVSVARLFNFPIPCFWGKALWRSPGQQRDFCRQLAAGCTRVSAGSNARLILGITDYNLPLPHLEALLEALDRDLTDSQEAEGDDLLHKDTCRPLKID